MHNEKIISSKMTKLYFLLVFACVIYENLNLVEACNGYTAKLNRIANCVDNPVIKLPQKASVQLDNNCNLILIGCIEITKPFKTAEGTYSLKKSPLPPLEGDLNFCEIIEELDDPRVGKVAAMYGMPKSCPVPAKKVCGTNKQKISLAQFKNQIGMASGSSEVKVEVDHDTGKSCLEIGLTVSKVKRG